MSFLDHEEKFADIIYESECPHTTVTKWINEGPWVGSARGDIIRQGRAIAATCVYFSDKTDHQRFRKDIEVWRNKRRLLINNGKTKYLFNTFTNAEDFLSLKSTTLKQTVSQDDFPYYDDNHHEVAADMEEMTWFGPVAFSDCHESSADVRKRVFIYVDERDGILFKLRWG